MRDFDTIISQNLPQSEHKPKRDLLSDILKVGRDFGEPERVFWVPGRIEVLGKHTDYAGGRSLLAATTRGFFFAVSSREDRQIQVVDAVSGERLESRVDPDVLPTVGRWSNYAETVFRRVARNFPGNLKGANIAFGSDLPLAAGMSSSSAMIVGFFLAMDAVNDFQSRPEYRQNIHTPEDLSGYLGTNENGQTFGSLVGDKGVGTFGGSEDHTAIMNCKVGNVSQYRYCPVRFEREIPLLDDYIFAIGASGVVAEKTGSAMEKYNRASRLAFEALATWNNASGANDPHLAGAVERVGAGAVRAELEKANHPEFSAIELVERFDHFYTENEEILPAAGDALALGDYKAFGKWVQRSQANGVSLLKNQIPETEALAALAYENGAVAASAFGAGFGGSVWALVERAGVGQFLEGWRAAYQLEYAEAVQKGSFFMTEAGPGAFALGD